MAELVVADNIVVGNVADDGTVTIGSDPSCTIRVTGDRYVSKLHARLIRKGDNVFIEDAGSTNGTMVNGKRIGGRRVQLRDGDWVRVGKTTLR